MGREVLRIPPDWQHPRDAQGDHIPLWPYSAYRAQIEDWDTRRRLWDTNAGNRRFMITSADGDYRDAVSFEEWTPIPRPTLDSYMPDWPTEQCTHYVMYRIHENGCTPMSPPCATKEELAQWLADNDIIMGDGCTADYKAWLHVITCDRMPLLLLKRGSKKYTTI